MELKYIEIESVWIQRVKNEFFDQNSKTLVVILPGYGYLSTAPLLYYNVSAALELDCDVLCVEYGFQKSQVDIDLWNEIGKVIQETLEIIKKSIATRHEKVIFIGKSLGTIIQNELTKKIGNREYANIYLTPIAQSISCIEEEKSLVIYGTLDKHICDNDIKLISEKENVTIRRIEGADHSLDLKNVLDSIEVLNEIIGCCYEFIRKNLATEIKPIV